MHPLGLVVTDNASYHAGPGTSSTQIKTLRDSSLLHFWHNHVRPDREPQEESDDLAFGSAIHSAVLEPDLFGQVYVKSKPFNRRTNAGRAMAEEFAAECAAKGKIAITPVQHQACLDIRDRVYAHPVVSGLLSGGRAEQSFYAIDPDYAADDLDANGVPYGLIRCRTDYLHDNGYAIVDLKSTKDAKPSAFAKDVANLGYDLSAAWYQRVFRSLYGEAPGHFIWVAVEKLPPYAMSVTFARAEDIARATELNSHHFARLVHARRTNTWPCYAEEVLPLDMPRWATRSIEL